jgi:hypothetical protein
MGGGDDIGANPPHDRADLDVRSRDVPQKCGGEWTVSAGSTECRVVGLGGVDDHDSDRARGKAGTNGNLAGTGSAAWSSARLLTARSKNCPATDAATVWCLGVPIVSRIYRKRLRHAGITLQRTMELGRVRAVRGGSFARLL